MLQLYVAIVGLLSRLFSLFFFSLPLHESSISPWTVCEYFGATLLCQSHWPKC